MGASVSPIIVQLIIALATPIISVIGVIYSSSKASDKQTALIEYKLEELKKHVDKHNNLIDRTYELEREVAVIQERLKEDN